MHFQLAVVPIDVSMIKYVVTIHINTTSFYAMKYFIGISYCGSLIIRNCLTSVSSVNVTDTQS